MSKTVIMKQEKTDSLVPWLLRIKQLLTVVTTACCLVLPDAGATSICRWTDDSGHVQFADVVPERYKSIVTCTHSQPSELSAEQRAAAELNRARNQKSDIPTQAESSQAKPETVVPQPATRQPAEVVTEATDCKTWQRLYEESGACFAPFRTAHGGLKSEAFDKCNQVPNPEQKCGPSRN